MSTKKVTNRLFVIGSSLIIIPLFYLFSVNYILFHTFIKLVSVSFAFTIFSIALNTRKHLKTNLYFTVGLGFAMAAILDIIHALAYDNFDLFVHSGLNMMTQTRIISRLIALTTTLVAIHIHNKNTKIRTVPIVICLGIVESVLLFLVCNNYLPEFYTAGTGFTTQTTVCAFIIIGLLFTLAYGFWKNRTFSDRTRRVIITCIVLLILSEIAFLKLVSEQSILSFVGHFLELLAYFYCYRILIEETLQMPFNTLFRSQEEAISALREQRHDILNEIALTSSYMQMNRHTEAIQCLDYMAADLSDQYNFETLPSKAWGKVLETKEAEAKNLGIEFTHAIEADLPSNINQLRYIPRIMASLIDTALVRTLSNANPKIHVSWNENDEKWELAVSNNGPQIPAEIANIIFDPAIESYDWSLRISSHLTKQLGGELQLISTTELTTASLVINKLRPQNS